jgi:hypothetical protein
MEISWFSIHLVDDGMRHASRISSKTLSICKNMHTEAIKLNATDKIGYIAVVNQKLKSEGGAIFTAALNEFHGEIVII